MELIWRYWPLLLMAGVLAQYEDLKGNYCGGPTQRCCDGRIDSCAVPILGTLCYCDQFCNRTDSSDCCPDYWNVCLGIQPPEPLVLQHGLKLIFYYHNFLKFSMQIGNGTNFWTTFDHSRMLSRWSAISLWADGANQLQQVVSMF